MEINKDILSEKRILEALGENSPYTLEVFDCVTSTNLILKERAARLPELRVAVASRQTAGRGRLGRSFYSPEGTGLYLSVLLRPILPPQDASLITTAAAVAVAEAVEDCGGAEPSIKWVNDVLLGGKKVCGILTESSVAPNGALDYAVLGVGINVSEPEGGFPEELRDIAGAVFREGRKGLREELAASFLRRFLPLYRHLAERSFVPEYRRRSFLIGRDILVLRAGSSVPARALDVDGDCRLIVRYLDGTTEALSSGEVSVRLTQQGVTS